jgi:hypothetical protein
VIHRSDGSTRTVASGTAQYHLTHAHYHHQGFGKLSLERVLDLDAGTHEHVSDGPKQGYCIAPYVVVNWRAFDNDPIRQHSTCDSRNDTPFEEAVMWLERGWSDVYGWSLDGNYVPVPADAPDGLYVISASTDSNDEIVETNDDDNASYALVQITGNEVHLVERGYGEGPWDPNHVVDDDPRVYGDADPQWVPLTDVL